MRNLSLKIVIAGIMGMFALSSCSDWTDSSPIKIPENSTDGLRDDAYYAALRQWKADPERRVSFVWFDAWTGGTAGAGALSGLPDSLIIASNWGSSWPLTESQIKDMRRVQELKGTKVVVTLLAGKLGDAITPREVSQDGYEGLTGNAALYRYWDIDDVNNPANRTTDVDRIDRAVRRYAKRIYDSVVKYGYDGFDWDYEPTFGGSGDNFLWQKQEYRKPFVDELTYWFGPGSQRADRGDRDPAIPGLLLQVDGEIGLTTGYDCDKDWPYHLIDHYILQAYGTSGKTNLNNRIKWVIDLLADNEYLTPAEIVKRTILTENFESYATNGGRLLSGGDGETLSGVLLMSQFVYDNGEINVQAGGFGIYRPGFDYNQGKGDYMGSSEYWFLRQGITRMNYTFERRKTEPGYMDINWGS